MKLGPKPRLLKVLDAAGISYVRTRTTTRFMCPASMPACPIRWSGERHLYPWPELRWGWIDELDFVANPRCTRRPKPPCAKADDYQLFITSTPKGQYIIYREWVVNRDDFHRLHKATTYDNFFVDAEDFVAGLGYAGSFYEQEINADFVKLEGLGLSRLRPHDASPCS
jgi:hypothetical protein